MVRPSQYIDQLLLDAGLELLPVTGCAGLSVRPRSDGFTLAMNIRSK